MAGVAHRGAKIGSSNAHQGDQVGVFQTGANAPVDLVRLLVGGDYSCQVIDVAVVDDLEQLFLGPGGGVLGAQVIQHQQADVADFVESIFKGRIRTVVGKTQPVQKVGNGQEKGRYAQADVVIGNGGSQVSFSAAITTGE